MYKVIEINKLIKKYEAMIYNYELSDGIKKLYKNKVDHLKSFRSIFIKN